MELGYLLLVVGFGTNLITLILASYLLYKERKMRRAHAYHIQKYFDISSSFREWSNRK